jgi:hypothetical protein
MIVSKAPDSTQQHTLAAPKHISLQVERALGVDAGCPSHA